MSRRTLRNQRDDAEARSRFLERELTEARQELIRTRNQRDYLAGRIAAERRRSAADIEDYKALAQSQLVRNSDLSVRVLELEAREPITVLELPASQPGPLLLDTYRGLGRVLEELDRPLELEASG